MEKINKNNKPKNDNNDKKHMLNCFEIETRLKKKK